MNRDTAVPRFVARLDAARTAAGLTRRQLAVKAGLDYTTIAHIASRNGACTLATAVRIAEVVGMSLDGLLDPCAHCHDAPPAGYPCQQCGTKGAES